MKHIINLLELITIIVWFLAVILSINGEVKPVVGVLCMTAGLWVIVAGISAYIKTNK